MTEIKKLDQNQNLNQHPIPTANTGTSTMTTSTKSKSKSRSNSKSKSPTPPLLERLNTNNASSDSNIETPGNDQNEQNNISQVPIFPSLPLNPVFPGIPAPTMIDAAAQLVSMSIPYGPQLNVQPFHFTYPGMHGHNHQSHDKEEAEEEALEALEAVEVDSPVDGEKDLKELMDTALKQDEVKPIKSPHAMRLPLYNHQRRGVAWMLQKESDRFVKGGLLGDEMGVGKTIQMIALMNLSREKARARKRKKRKNGDDTSDDDDFDEDSNDETLNGFVVGDETVEYQSDEEKKKKKENEGVQGDWSEDEWSSNLEFSDDEGANTKSSKCSDSRDQKVQNKSNRNYHRNHNVSRHSRRSRRSRQRNGRTQTQSMECDDLSDDDDGVYNPDSDRYDESQENEELDTDHLNDDDWSDSEDLSVPHDFDENLNSKLSKPSKPLKPLQRPLLLQKRKREPTLYELLDSMNNPPSKRRKTLNWNPLSQTRDQLLDDTLRQTSKSLQRTLIIGPVAILDQWAEEIEDKCPGQFNVVVYHGPRRKKWDKRSLIDVDVVITTYPTLSSEWKGGDEEKWKGLYLLPIGFFYRIVLDEAHTIKNPATAQSKACADIGSRGVTTRWCLTGTPIQNKLLDIYPLGRFLQIPHCATAHDFKKYMSIQGEGNILSRNTKVKVTTFLAAHMLRRLKSEVVDDLVSKTTQVLELQFDDAEKELYEAFQKRARSRFDALVERGIARRNYVHILALLVRLRQICDHPLLVAGSREVQEEGVNIDLSQTSGAADHHKKKDPLEKVDPAVIRRINAKETSILDSECPICMDRFQEGVMFPKCGHMICKEHLHDLEVCGECRRSFKVNEVIPFKALIDSPLIDEKHKKSLWAGDGREGMVMDGHMIVERMRSSLQALTPENKLRRIVWKKVCRAKGEHRTKEEKRLDAEQQLEDEKEKTMDPQEVKKRKMEKLQRKFDWNTFTVDLPFCAQFEDDDCSGYGIDDEYRGWTFFPSTKTKMILQQIQWIRKEYPNDKMIIFSQFVQALRILERVLDKHKIQYLLYEGSMKRHERKETVDQWKNDAVQNQYPVMLMSLKCGSLGLNLTVANHVIFTDLWWNPAVELQAVDRVHRIGQKKHVRVTRIVIKDSLEERILALQREKQKIADSALDGANFLKNQKLTLSELAKLFGSDDKIVRKAQRSDNNAFSRASIAGNSRRRR